MLAWALVTAEALRAPHVLRNKAATQSQTCKLLTLLAHWDGAQVLSGTTGGLVYRLSCHLSLITHYHRGSPTVASIMHAGSGIRYLVSLQPLRELALE